MLPIQRPPHQDALHGFSQVEPGAAEGRVQRHDAVLEQPADQVRGLVAGQIVENQERPQWWELSQQCRADRQPRLPRLPAGTGGLGSGARWRQGGKDGGQFLLQPGMQDRVGRSLHRQRPDLARGGSEQGQQLGSASSDVLVGLTRRLALRLPGATGLWNSLVGPGFIFTPHRQAQGFAQTVGLFDQPLFAVASGSVTVTVPRLRLRRAVPVGHQVRLCCQV